jgi:hypothetical protein
MKTRTEITFEMDRLIVVNRSHRTEWSSPPVETPTADNAAFMAALLRLLEEEKDDRPED